MRYFKYLSSNEEKAFFFLPPQLINRNDQFMLEHALGATLYMPAIRKTVAQDIINQKFQGLMSMVLCLEDAISDHEVINAEELVVYTIKQLALAINTGVFSLSDLPMIFVRVREAQQMVRLTELLEEDASLLTGFIFPKFTPENGEIYFENLAKINKHQTKTIYGMPILEAPEVLYIESRHANLLAIKKLLNQYRELVLNIRIGATDFSGLFGLRRNADFTIYDLSLLRSCIADIVNIFVRPENPYVISGPVWEFFSKHSSDNALTGLITEVKLDKLNGLTGKTIIHPSHIKPVQALCVVTHEEYLDASSILGSADSSGGVISSHYGNKMNEIKPHMRWAQKIMIKSKIYGVFNEQHNFASLL